MAEENKNKNLREKLQDARILLKEENIKKSGVNSFLKANYYTLSDIQPPITKVCQAVRICPLITFDDISLATLTIYDMDSDDVLVVKTPMTEIKVNDDKKKSLMQELLGTETYARRAILLSTFDIVEEGVDEKVDDLESHDILMVKTRIERTMTELLKSGMDFNDILKEIGLKDDKQYNSYINACNIINKMETNMNILLNSKRK